MPRSPEQVPAPEEEPTKSREEIDEETRKKSAAKLGLPETASITDIITAIDEENRKKAATEMELPETATWMDIHVARAKAYPRGKAYPKKE